MRLRKIFVWGWLFATLLTFSLQSVKADDQLVDSALSVLSVILIEEGDLSQMLAPALADFVRENGGVTVDTRLNEILAKFQKADFKLANVQIGILENDELNAVAVLADGRHIYIFRGLYRRLLAEPNGEQMLSAVIAHELGHFRRRHALKGFKKLTIAGEAVKLLAKGLDANQEIETALKVVKELAWLDNSRGNEKEADDYSIDLMAKTPGLDPRAVINLHRWFKEEAGDFPKSLKFLSSHPLSSERVKRAEKRVKVLEEKKPATRVESPRSFDQAPEILAPLKVVKLKTWPEKLAEAEIGDWLEGVEPARAPMGLAPLKVAWDCFSDPEKAKRIACGAVVAIADINGREMAKAIVHGQVNPDFCGLSVLPESVQNIADGLANRGWKIHLPPPSLRLEGLASVSPGCLRPGLIFF